MTQDKTLPEQWHENPVAQRLISRLNCDNLREVKQASIPADYYEFRGGTDKASRTITALNEMRCATIAEAMGVEFEGLEGDLALAYIDAEIIAPTVYDVVSKAIKVRVGEVA